MCFHYGEKEESAYLSTHTWNLVSHNGIGSMSRYNATSALSMKAALKERLKGVVSAYVSHTAYSVPERLQTLLPQVLFTSAAKTPGSLFPVQTV